MVTQVEAHDLIRVLEMGGELDMTPSAIQLIDKSDQAPTLGLDGPGDPFLTKDRSVLTQLQQSELEDGLGQLEIEAGLGGAISFDSQG